MNSRLSCGKLARTFGVQLTDWREGLREASGLYHATAGGETTWFGFA